MSWRRRVPTAWRAWRVDHWVRAADDAEASAKAAQLLNRPDWASEHAKRAIRAYLKALEWRPFRYPVELPAPGEFSAPGHEYMPEARGAKRELIECVLCGALMPMPTKQEAAEGTGGLYCSRCA